MKKLLLAITWGLSMGLGCYAQSKPFWGMTSEGGEFGAGAIFSADGTGGNAAVQYSFFRYEGGNPWGHLVQAANGNFYGMTQVGGANGMGVLFEYNPRTNSYVKKLDFAGATNGGYPLGSLARAGDGKLYGMTNVGGINNLGVLFQFDPAIGAYLKVLDFDGVTNGQSPTGSLIQASDGKLYGMTTAGGVNGKGVLFQYDPVTSTYVKKFDFDGAGSGSIPHGSLMQARNGKFYGVTQQGGVNNSGTLFEYDPVTSSYSKKVDFVSATHGSNQLGSLVQAGDDNLYGIAPGGGANGMGVLFQYNPATVTFTKKLDFAGTTSGSYPNGSLILASNGKLYGMTHDGGANDFGVLFQYDPANSSYTKRFDFDGTSSGSRPIGALMQASDGKVYGLTHQGGSNDLGVLFQFDVAVSTFIKKIDFGGAISGRGPYGSLTQAPNGKLYGLTNQGGASELGVLFQYDPGTNSFEKKLDFLGSTNGSRPNGSLMLASDDKFYGVAPSGGANDSGVLFQYDPASNTFTKKFDFSGTTSGSIPYGPLIQASNGKLYGMTVNGGTHNMGVLFQFDPVSSSYSKKLDLEDTFTGSFNTSAMILGADGKLYGLMLQGGANSRGVLFQYDPSSNTYIKKVEFTGGADGGFPNSSLVQASDGKLYGMTSQGGASDMGVLFQFDPGSSTYTKNLDFTGITNGNYPNGALMLGSDNKLYGMTARGGVNDSGVLFEYDPATNTYTKKLDFNGANGKYPLYTALIEIAVPISITTNSVKTSNCVGSTIPISYTLGGIFNANNIFSAQLSNSSGSFATPTTIGSTLAVIDGTIDALIPVTTPAGQGYRIRVVSSDPIVTGTDNGVNIVVNALPAVTASATEPTLCAGASTLLKGGGAITYSWSDEVIDGGAFAPAATATYTVTGTDANGCSNTATQTVAVNGLPPKPTIAISDVHTVTPTLTSSAAIGNQWYFDDEAIPGATNSTLVAHAPGIYNVQDQIGDCVSERSDNFPVIITGDIVTFHVTMEVYPNPVEAYLEIRGIKGEVDRVDLFDMTGRVAPITLEKTGETYHGQAQHLLQGLYLLRVHQGTGVRQMKFIKK